MEHPESAYEEYNMMETYAPPRSKKGINQFYI